MGKFCKETIVKIGDINLKKNGAVLLYLNMSGLDSLILCLVGVLHLEIQIHHSLCKNCYFSIDEEYT